MNTLVALALSTPVWGFALQPPTVAPSIAPEHVVQVLIGSPAPGAPVRAPGALPYAPSADEHSSTQLLIGSSAPGAPVRAPGALPYAISADEHSSTQVLIGSPAPGAPVRAPTALPYAISADEHSSTQLRAIEAMEEALDAQEELEADDRNLTTMEWTRSLSLATITAFAFGAGLGFVQFADEYGFHGSYQETACATGDAVLDYCGEATPWAHLGAIGATAGLGLTTFVLSTQVDYERAARVDADWRIYEVTRWVGLAMFLVQAAGGALLANALRFGWADEQRDFETLQALAAAHMAWGAATLGMEVYNTAILF